jgi:hypothetical protein
MDLDVSGVLTFHHQSFMEPPTMTVEEDRTRLIGEIARVLREGPVPEEARAAALTLIGWLARRMPGESAHAAGVAECRARMAALCDHDG